MMKTRFILSLLVVAAGLTYIVSCDKIEEPFTRNAGNTDTAACPSPEFPSVTVLERRVLLEDYTGHTCVNCPAAAHLAHNLKETHGDRLVLIAVHAGWFANPSASGDFSYDFRTEAGTAWDNFFGVGLVGNPKGLINRIGYPGNHIIDPSAWSDVVDDELSIQPLVDLQMINEFDAVERKLCTHIKTRFVTAIDRNLKLIVVLTESGIIKPQKDNNEEVPIIYNYEHNHVLRAAITSTWGNTVATAGIANGESLVKSYKYIIPNEYVAENCAVVAFIYDEDTKEVLQAVESAVTE